MEPQRPFAGVPRRWLTGAAVVGGIGGLILSQHFRWSEVESFIYTLFIAFGCVAATALVYGALVGRRDES